MFKQLTVQYYGNVISMQFTGTYYRCYTVLSQNQMYETDWTTNRTFPVGDAQVIHLNPVRSAQGLMVHERAQVKKLVRVGVGILNVGTMTARGRELADLMERRKVGVLCVRRRPGGRGTRRNSWEEAASCYVVGQMSKGEMECG